MFECKPRTPIQNIIESSRRRGQFATMSTVLNWHDVAWIEKCVANPDALTIGDLCALCEWAHEPRHRRAFCVALLRRVSS